MLAVLAVLRGGEGAELDVVEPLNMQDEQLGTLYCHMTEGTGEQTWLRPGLEV